MRQSPVRLLTPDEPAERVLVGVIEDIAERHAEPELRVADQTRVTDQDTVTPDRAPTEIGEDPDPVRPVVPPEPLQDTRLRAR